MPVAIKAPLLGISGSCRSATDRRVVEVMSIFEAHVASPTREGRRDRLAAEFVSLVCDDVSPERFVVPLWSDAALRAVLRTTLLHAPAGDLRAMVRRARAQRNWLRCWEDDWRAEERGEPRGIRLGTRADRAKSAFSGKQVP
jgi:hypothetical protein